MSNLSTTRKNKRSKPRKSGFQNLWDKADRLQKQNEQLKSSLDELVARAEQKIQPVEKAAVEAERPLLKKLLTMGQRKSLAKWEREVLGEWIQELVTAMRMFNLADNELRDDVARYDAFRLGIELNEDIDGASGTPHEQVSIYIQNLQREAQEAYDQERAKEQAVFDSANEQMEELVEGILDEHFGPPPTTDNAQSATQDIFQDELDAELKKQADDYHAKRSAMRDKIMRELEEDMQFEESMHGGFGTSDFDDDDFDEDPFANAEFEYEFHGKSRGPAAPKIDNQTFHKMFRATAAKLHPDREADPERRLEKQKLMADLLKARKNGDLLTVFKMYQQFTNNSESFSKTDEKQLTEALRQHIDQLKEEKDNIISQSPLHYDMYKRFYHASKKKQDQKIEQHIEKIRENSVESTKRYSTIKSLKTLKPWLEERYELLQFSAMDDFMDDLDWQNHPF